MTNAQGMLTALGDPTRQAIFDQLSDGPRAVGEIADDLPVSRPAVSQHLKVLKEAGLVLAEQTVAPIRRGITVDVPQERAFDVFAADMTSWWPAEHHIGSAPIAEIVIEPRAGGRWYTRHEDGTETDTGVVTTWQ